MLLLKVVSALMWIYDLVTYPLYWIVQQPWKVIALRKRPKFICEQIDNNTIKLTSGFIKEPCRTSKYFEEKSDGTLTHLFDWLEEQYGERPCMGSRKILGYKEGTFNGNPVQKVSKSDQPDFLTFSQVAEITRQIARCLLSMFGVEPGDKVLIISATRKEWMLTAIGAWKAGCTVVTQLPIVTLGTLESTMINSEPEVVVTDRECLAKVKALLDKNPQLYSGKIICLDNDSGSEDVLSFGQVVKEGQRSKGHSELPHIRRNDMAVIMYTGGTGGEPKGVWFNHGTLTSALDSLQYSGSNFMTQTDEHCFLAYLPQAHSFELTQELGWLSRGASVGYGSPYTLTENSPQTVSGELGDLASFKPCYMVAVPLVVNRIKASVEAKIASKGRTFEQLFKYFVDYKWTWIQKGFKTPLLDMLVFRKIRSAFGGNLKYVAVGGAPLSPECQNFFRSVVCCTIQGYGATETSATGVVQSHWTTNTGDIGLIAKNLTLLIKDWNEGGYSVNDPNGPSGELIIGGHCVGDGYFKLEDSGSFYKENGIKWFKTGDIVQFDPITESVRVVDRKNQVVKLQNGEFVSLGTIDNTLTGSKFVDIACAVARPDKNSIVAVVVPDANNLSKLDQVEKGPLPMDSLAKAMLRILNAEFGDILKGNQMPKAVVIAEGPWTPECGLVTGAMKIKRREVERQFALELEAAFQELN